MPGLSYPRGTPGVQDATHRLITMNFRCRLPAVLWALGVIWITLAPGLGAQEQ